MRHAKSIAFFFILGLSTWHVCYASSNANLIYNSSFEAGIDYRFSVGRWYRSGVPSLELDKTSKVHGNYSLRLPYSRRHSGYDGILFRSSLPIFLKANKNYTFSAYLRTSVPTKGYLILVTQGPLDKGSSPLAAKTVSIKEKWGRHYITYRPRVSEYVYWAISANSGSPGNIWVDAIKLEQSSHVSAYKPSEIAEVALTSEKSGKIYDKGEPIVVTLRAYNHASTIIAKKRFRIDVFSLDGSRVISYKSEITLNPKQNTILPLELPIKRNGIYRAELLIGEQVVPQSVLNFSVLPVQRDIPAAHSSFGAYITLSSEPLKIMRRVGFSWIANLTSNNYLTAWSEVEKSKDKFNWYDEDVALGARLGFEYMFNLGPHKAPAWVRSLPPHERHNRWIIYVKAMVARYGKTVKYWTIGDETHKIQGKSIKREYWKNAREYAQWHKDGYNVIKSVNESTKIIFNSSPEFSEQVLHHLSAKTVDVLAGNYYHNSGTIKRLKKVAQRNKIDEVWAPGVGLYTFPYYSEHVSAKKRSAMQDSGNWVDINKNLIKQVVQTFVYGATRLFHYTATYVGNTNNFSLFELDSGLRPNGVQFAVLIWLLDGFVNAHEVDIVASKKRIKAYRFNRRDRISVFPIWSQTENTWQVSLPKTGSLNASRIKIYDQYGNSYPIKIDGNRINFNVSNNPIFIIVQNNNADLIEKSFKSVNIISI